jgi:hypothetical protein
MAAPERFRVNSPKVIHQTIDGEVIIINLETGNYYSLSKSGATIWDAIRATSRVEDIVNDLALQYDGPHEQLEQQAVQFVSALQAEGLIVALNDLVQTIERSPTIREKPATRSVYEPPVLERFEDMQDLILLDPVHDVEEEEGWPRART